VTAYSQVANYNDVIEADKRFLVILQKAAKYYADLRLVLTGRAETRCKLIG
jgi:hypothetical protein